MTNIPRETKEALSVALDHLLNAGKITNERMTLFGLLKGANPVERELVLSKIRDLREKVLDAQLLLKLYLD